MSPAIADPETMTNPASASQAITPFLRRRLSQNTMTAAANPNPIASCEEATCLVPQKIRTGRMLQ